MASTADSAIAPALPRPITLRTSHIPRPGATPQRKRLDAFIDAFISLGVGHRASPLAAAQLAGWRGSVAAVSRRARRILGRPDVRALIAERLELRLASVPSAQQVLSEMGHLAMGRGEAIEASWWRTNAKVKALEFLGKHYGLASESLIVREMPKNVADAAHVVAHELVRLGVGASGEAVFGAAPALEAPPETPPTTAPDTSEPRMIAPAGVYDVAAEPVLPVDPAPEAQAPAPPPRRPKPRARKPAPKPKRRRRSAGR